jgi:FkbM family methyltransferase
VIVTRRLSKKQIAECWRMIRDPNQMGEFFEIQLEEILTKLLTKNAVFLDGGANWGRHSIPSSKKVGPNGLVISIEPVPKLAGHLLQFGFPNVLVVEAGLSDRQEMLDFFFAEDLDGYSSLRSRPEFDGESIDKIKINVTTLDTLRKDIGRKFDFLKLDIEGAEFHAFLGAKSMLINDKPIVIFENGLGQSAQRFNYTEKQFFDFFKEIDFKIMDFFGEELSDFEINPQENKPWYFVAYPSVYTKKQIRKFIIESCLQAMKTYKREFEYNWWRKLLRTEMRKFTRDKVNLDVT